MNNTCLPAPTPCWSAAGLQQDPPEGVNASPQPENIMRWNAVIFGPDGTIWDGGVFKLRMEFSEDYPNKAPLVKFKTRMFHPNSELPSTWLRGTMGQLWQRCSLQRRCCCSLVVGPDCALHCLPAWVAVDVLNRRLRLASLQSMLTAASVWTSYRISGAPSTMSQPSSPPSSPCSLTPTPTRQPTRRPHGCSMRTGGSTTGG